MSWRGEGLRGEGRGTAVANGEKDASAHGMHTQLGSPQYTELLSNVIVRRLLYHCCIHSGCMDMGGSVKKEGKLASGGTASPVWMPRDWRNGLGTDGPLTQHASMCVVTPRRCQLM